MYSFRMGHTRTNLLLHVVFSTYRREPLLADHFRKRVDSWMAASLQGMHCDSIAINGIADHVHLLFRMTTDRCLAEIMRELKAHSSGWVHRTIPNLKGFAWQSGYGAFSVSTSAVARVQEYIANQEEYHRTRSFAEEYAELLRRHGFKD